MSPSVTLESGEIFAGHYVVERRLSAGGMGAVYVVTDINTDRQRALKVMLAEVAMRDDAAARFSREARVGASIHSDHVVEVVDAGVDEETNTPFLVMELLEGEDLAAIMARRGPLSPSEVLVIFEQLCHALAAAQRANVVHRDLKPENLFMSRSRRSDGDVTLKILDFGIAKIVAETHTGGATQSIGTPLWMAPEQTQSGSRISPATDLWALGLIAFYLLTGRSYWRAANADEHQPMALLREVALEPLEPASARAAELGVDHLVPEGFDSWFARTVVRDPSARYGSAEEVFEQLRARLGEGEAPREMQLAKTVADVEIEAAEPNAPAAANTTATTAMVAAPAEAPPSTRRHVYLAAAAVLGAVAFVLVKGRVESESTAGPVASTAASAAPVLNSPAVGLEAVALFVAPPDKHIGDLSAAAFWLGAAKSFREAAAQPGAPVRWRAAQHFCEGEVALLEGQHDHAVRAFGDAIALDGAWAVPYTGLALALSRRGEGAKALDAALAAAQRDPAWYRPLLVTASVYARDGKLEEALVERRRALEKHPDNAALMAEVALGCHAVRLDSEAERFAHAALDKDPNLVAPRLLLAERALEAGDGKAALEHATRAAASAPRHAASHLARADALVLEGDPAEAKRAYGRAIALADETNVEDAHLGRWQVVRTALAEGRLPPRRGETSAATSPHRTPHMPAPAPHRTACSPGDPLCGDI